MTQVQNIPFEPTRATQRIEDGLLKLKTFVLDNIDKFDKLPENEMIAIKTFFSFEPTEVARKIEDQFGIISSSLNDALTQIKANPESQEQIVADLFTKATAGVEDKLKMLENFLK